MKNVTYRKHLTVHNICKSTKKSLQLKTVTAHCFYSLCKKNEREKGTLVIVAFFPLKEEQKL